MFNTFRRTPATAPAPQAVFPAPSLGESFTRFVTTAELTAHRRMVLSLGGAVIRSAPTHDGYYVTVRLPLAMIAAQINLDEQA